MRTLSQFALVSALAVAIAAGAAIGGQASAETFVNAPQPRVTAPATGKIETAIFAGGCFWASKGSSIM